jgi:hypothetical protein
MAKLVQRLRDERIYIPTDPVLLSKFLTPPRPDYKPQSTRDGGEGFVKWCNENVCVPIYPPGSPTVAWTLLGELPQEIHAETNKSYASMWWTQQNICREALRMVDGRFIYRLIVLCWQRGEGKSLLACLIQIWKFFNFPRQQIMLGANSRDQVKFVHYDIMRDIIQNSPNLLAAMGTKRNIQEKEIRLKGRDGVVRSLIRSISSFSGIVSNITGYTFSEIFDMKKPKFFVQLDGSIRNMPNALGVIDSTVSEKTHVLYQLYESFITKKTKSVFFNYRSSKTGDIDDYMNPHMTTDQLEDYKAKFPFGEFERYFLNTWEAGRTQIFDEAMIASTRIMSVDGQMLNNEIIQNACNRRIEILNSVGSNKEKGFDTDFLHVQIQDIDRRFKYIDDVVHMDGMTMYPATYDMLRHMSEIFDTDWSILCGLDMGDPLAIRGQARTMLSVVAKGLVGSKSNPTLARLTEAAPKYFYVLLYMMNIENHSVNGMKETLDLVDVEYDGIDVLCSERWGAWDMGGWCDERTIKFEPIYPNYDRQKAAFKEFYTCCKEGRFKAPHVPIEGSKKDDILREEMGAFDHWTKSPDPATSTFMFGSREKFERGGIQDDSIYATGWALYGGRELGVDDFRLRRMGSGFGFFAAQEGLLGKY